MKILIVSDNREFNFFYFNKKNLNRVNKVIERSVYVLKTENHS